MNERLLSDEKILEAYDEAVHACQRMFPLSDCMIW